MRTFCTEGPVDPEKNYYVPRTDLLEIGLKKVDEWRYFTIFAPRQSGKSTYFKFLIDVIHQKKDYLPLWISFEGYGNCDEKYFLELFVRNLDIELELAGYSSEIQWNPKQLPDIPDYFVKLFKNIQKDFVLIIDEFEGLRNTDVLNQFLHIIRSIYHKREKYHLRSLILVGVSNITGIIQDTASPFNIADQIEIPYFTFEETKDLLLQHTSETEQVFDDDVILGIYDNTAGQPGLVNALARDLVEKRVVDGTKITSESFYTSLDAFMRLYADKNIANVVNKAKKYPELMKQILFDGPVNFTTYDDRISFLKVNGVIVNDNGICAIPVPIYQKCLYQTFKPLLNGNGERRYFKDPFVDEAVYLDQEGFLDMEKLLDKYADYIRERGNIIFSQDRAKEGIYHYNLDAFLASYASVFGGVVFPEVPEGGGRVDLLVLQKNKKWIIEVKRFQTQREWNKAKDQLVSYIERSGITKGYYVVFSDVHKEQQKEKEFYHGYEIFWWILPVKMTVPTFEWR